MDDPRRVGGGPSHVLGDENVAAKYGRAELLERPRVGALAHERGHVLVPFAQQPDDRAPEKTGRPGDERRHRGRVNTTRSASDS